MGYIMVYPPSWAIDKNKANNPLVSRIGHGYLALIVYCTSFSYGYIQLFNVKHAFTDGSLVCRCFFCIHSYIWSRSNKTHHNADGQTLVPLGTKPEAFKRCRTQSIRCFGESWSLFLKVTKCSICGDCPHEVYLSYISGWKSPSN